MRRAVYVVRDPRDVVVSHFYEHQRVFPERIREMRPFVEASLAGRLWPGAWDEHVRGWRNRIASGDVLLIRYEDLHADTIESFRRIVGFVGLGCSEPELLAAVEGSGFERLRSIERVGGAPGRGDASVPLVRRGRVGSWAEELEPGLARQVETRYGEVMTELGYSPRVTGADAC